VSLIITIGVPGAGKSTWADEFCASRPEYLRLERDRFREAIFGSRRAYHEHPFDRVTRSDILSHAMMGAVRQWPNDKIVLSDTGLLFRAVRPFVEYADRFRVPIKLKTFDVPDDVLRERNRTRPEEHRIPDDILESCIADFRKEDAWWKVLR
jgi:predicted kinase